MSNLDILAPNLYFLCLFISRKFRESSDWDAPLVYILQLPIQLFCASISCWGQLCFAWGHRFAWGHDVCLGTSLPGSHLFSNLVLKTLWGPTRNTRVGAKMILSWKRDIQQMQKEAFSVSLLYQQQLLGNEASTSPFFGTSLLPGKRPKINLQ